MGCLCGLCDRIRAKVCGGRRFGTFYKMGTKLGAGAFGYVCLAHDRATEEKVAVKVVTRKDLTPEHEAHFHLEVDVLRALNHPHIIGFHDFFSERGRYYLVMELCTGGELLDKIVEKKRYTEKEARDLVRILLDAIAYMHDRQIVHRDLKPENLLLTDANKVSSIKVCDFGFAEKLTTPNSLTEMLGSPGYVAPEIIKGIPYGEAVDNWSIGVVIYILLGGYSPFGHGDGPQTMSRVRSGTYQFHPTPWDSVSNEAKDMIRNLLVVDPEKRMTARQALEHGWMHADDHALDRRDLNASLIKLKTFNAKGKWRAGVEAVIFTQRLSRSFSSRSSISEEPPVLDESSSRRGSRYGSMSSLEGNSIVEELEGDEKEEDVKDEREEANERTKLIA